MSSNSRHLSFTTALRLRMVQLVAAAVPRAPAVWRGAVPALGTIGWAVSPCQRRAVQANLAHLLPDSTQRLRSRLSRQIFRSVARHYVWFFSLPGMPPSKLDRLAHVHGYANFLAAQQLGRGVILVGIHQGPAETMLQAFAARNVHYTAMVEELQPPALDARFRAIRESWGHRYVTAGLPGTKALLNTLRRGGVVALLADRDVLASGQTVELLGAPYRAPAGPIELALLTGAAIVPGYVHWQRDGTLNASLLPRFEVRARRRDRDSVRRDMERLLDLYMPHLRAYPGQWLVLERLWQNGSNVSGSYTDAHDGRLSPAPQT